MKRLSLRLDVSDLDDRPPSVDFRALKVGKRIRRLPATWKNLLPKLL
jgi:hypothetical protein